MLGVQTNNIGHLYNIGAITQKSNAAPSFCSDSINTGKPVFQANTNDYSIRTTLTTKEETEKYNKLLSILDKNSKKNLESALKSGILLQNNSNDKSTTLDNLYKMATTPRAEGMNASLLIGHTLTAIVNPFTITQRFGNIPDSQRANVLGIFTNNTKNLIERKIAEYDIDDLYSGCCPAASEEFNLAKTNPAEFARFAEGLTSPEMAVTKEIKLSSLSDKTLDAIWILNAFEVPYETTDWQTAKLKLAPDKYAKIREHIQEIDKDPLERSPIDVLMQSTFMNVGSQQTYNTINDKRYGKFSMDNKGLIEFEKTFVESVVEDKNITSVIYQNVDENQKIIGYEADYDTVKNQLLETLNSGHNIIIGYTMTDDNNYIIGGHEITIIGTKTGKNGELSFICNDTDDDNSAPIEYPASYLIPKIHHAGIPTEIAEKNMSKIDSWRLGVNDFNNNKAS